MPERIYPIEPPDEAVVGAQPIFQIGYDSATEIRASRLDFRIVLEALDEAGRDARFDQRDSRRGWLTGPPGQVVFRPGEPVEDGRYRWTVSYWDGVQWAGRSLPRLLRVDSVPPADVLGLRLTLGPEGGQVTLRWDPIGVDREGRPEFVARYHVYRYGRLGVFPPAKLYEIGVTEGPRFVDSNPGEGDLIFYKVTAEDEAGNEPEAWR